MSVNTSFIDKGRILRAVDNTEDALTHMTVEIGGRKCVCGNYGCLDCYASAKGIMGQISHKMKIGIPTTIKADPDKLTISMIAEAAKQGDELARSELSYAASVLGIGLANYIRLINPDTVILTSLIIRYSDFYYETVVREVKQQLANSGQAKNIKFLKLTDSYKTGRSSTTLFLEHLLNPNEIPVIKM